MNINFRKKINCLKNEFEHSSVDGLAVNGWDSFGTMSFFRIIGHAADANKDHLINIKQYSGMLSGIANKQTEIAYFIGSIDSELTILIGVSNNQLENVQNAYAALYPETNITNLNQYSFNQVINTFRAGGAIIGYPSDFKAQDVTDYNENGWDCVIRGMNGKDWGVLICARSVCDEYMTDITSIISEEISETVPFVKKTYSGQGALKNEQSEEFNQDAQNYIDVLKILQERMISASMRGAWRTCVYYMAENESVSNQLAGTVKSMFSGQDSNPYKISSIRIANIMQYLSKNIGFADNMLREDMCSFLAEGESDGRFRKNEPNCYFSRYLQNVMGTDELAIYYQLPEKEMPGYYINPVMTFDNAQRNDVTELKIGNIIINGEESTNNGYYIKKEDLTRHGLINGITGGGKSNTAKYLLKELYEKNKVPFMVIESAKQEYYELARIFRNDDLIIFTLGYEGANSVKYRLNPFERVGGVPLQLHIDYVLASFKASFELYPPMPYILEKSVYKIYDQYGWDVVKDVNRLGKDDYPTLQDLYYEIECVANDMAKNAKWVNDAVASLQARVESLMVGGKGAMLNTKKSFPISELLNRPVVMELDSIGDDDIKSFVISCVLVQLYEYRKGTMGEETKKKFQHLLLVEEAHRLLKNVSGDRGGEGANPQAKAVEFFCNMLAEIRSYGQGLLISDQMPTKLAPDVLRNTNLKICHRIVTSEDRNLIGGSMNMTEEQIANISLFKTGVAAVYSEGDNRPKLVKIPLVKDINSKSRKNIVDYSNEQVKKKMPAEMNKRCDSFICNMCNKCRSYLVTENAMEKVKDVFFKNIKTATNGKCNAEIIGEMVRILEEKVYGKKMNREEILCIVRALRKHIIASDASVRRALYDYLNK